MNKNPDAFFIFIQGGLVGVFALDLDEFFLPLESGSDSICHVRIPGCVVCRFYGKLIADFGTKLSASTASDSVEKFVVNAALRIPFQEVAMPNLRLSMRKIKDVLRQELCRVGAMV
ncbi:MAG: hypothetical protein EOM03_07160 [Clostridia bacterium]|nr:hypothetical protein [Clostridia bacterium]